MDRHEKMGKASEKDADSLTAIPGERQCRPSEGDEVERPAMFDVVTRAGARTSKADSTVRPSQASARLVADKHSQKD